MPATIPASQRQRQPAFRHPEIFHKLFLQVEELSNYYHGGTDKKFNRAGFNLKDLAA
jgi:hypothetical protein